MTVIGLARLSSVPDISGQPISGDYLDVTFFVDNTSGSHELTFSGDETYVAYPGIEAAEAGMDQPVNGSSEPTT